MLLQRIYTTFTTYADKMDKNSEEQLTLPIVETWSLNALKEFVRKRGLNVTGTKKVLAARAYVAWELQLPLLPTPVEVIRQKKDHISDCTCHH